jgi:hypothetical protein
MKIDEYRRLIEKKPERKYKNVVSHVGDIKFDSIKEAKQYGELKLRERLGEITDLKMQVRIECFVNGVKICAYIADFQYRIIERNVLITEDVKSDATRKLPVYRLKKKLVRACTGIEIIEI